MTLREPPCDMVSTMTLRFGSSARTRKMFSPPMMSSRFSTTSRSPSMNAWTRPGSRVTSVGAAKRANSAMASFSLWSRIASGALNTLAPSRTAADSSQVLTTYSRSKGGSLRISTAANCASGRVCVSCARYQSSSLSVNERRVAAAAVLPFHSRSFTSHTHTPWPRTCAARIMVTVVSLYALSVSGGSTTKSSCRARLFAHRRLLLRRGGRLEARASLVRHEYHGARHLVVRERCIAAARRHRALALDRRGDHVFQAFLDVRRPGLVVTDLGRVRDAGLVAGCAHRFNDLLAAASARGAARGAELDPRDGLDARRHRFRRHRAGVGARAAHDQLHQHDDADDRHHERKQDHHDQLLRGLDERRLGAVLAHWGVRFGIKV